MRFPEYLKEQLDTYMSQFPKVRIIRLKERQGLIRARLAGAAAATGSSPSAQLLCFVWDTAPADERAENDCCSV